MANFAPLNKKEIESAYQDLVRGKRPIQVSIEGQIIKQGNVDSRASGKIYFTLPFVQRFEGNHSAVVSFSLPPEVFFLKTKVSAVDGKYFFSEGEVFRLQRRDTFRVNLKEIGKAEVKFESGGSFPIHDISQGGLSVELNADKSDHFVTGSQLLADLTLFGETIQGVLCEAKHARVQPSDRSKVLVGFQFLKLGPENKENLFRIVTDIARKHFR